MHFASADALERARRVKLMLFDADGVLTDGRLWYGPGGEEIKAFHARDGHGIRMLAASGVRVAILSGRSSPALSARAQELGIEDVVQGAAEKRAPFEALLRKAGLGAGESAYLGDDLVDLPVLSRCGFACAVSEAPREVRERAHYVAAAPAGGGAVREVCEYIMRAQGSYDGALQEYLR